MTAALHCGLDSSSARNSCPAAYSRDAHGIIASVLPRQNIAALCSSAILFYAAIDHTDRGVNTFQQSAIARMALALINNKQVKNVD
ncbi:hypothetical protein [Collimonas sp.]|jgi:hypothetical protein|uniref:hypothetical protein n=1 Tax=Collimonas sp. TaxID=1963772 RepID=UPI002CFB9858|nr:hypothetical protein [Collimonas sp.]HWX02623.1 hypothetical protein [Collimonas sp.]